MKQLTFLAKGRLDWRDAPQPGLRGDEEALVRPLSVATCDLDRAIVAGLVPVAEPFPFGHECIAEVTEAGAAVQSVAPGQIVSVPFQISCGHCSACRRGHTAHCGSVEPLAMYGLPMGTNYGGFFSDSVRVPFADAMLVPIPDDIAPTSVASLSDNIADAWRTVGPPLAEQPHAPVLIAAGGGSIALYAAAIAVALGAQRVDIVGGTPAERTKAQQLGAGLLDERFPGKVSDSYPITVDASADPDGLACALRSTAPEGVCTSTGIYFTDTTPLPLLQMYTNGIRFHTGRVHARTAMESILQLVRAGRFTPELVTGQTASWDDAPEAVATHRSKLVISRPPSSAGVPRR